MIGSSSVASIAHLIFGRLAEARHGAGDPIGGPGDQLLGVDDRQSKQFDSLRCIREPGGRLLPSDNDGLAAEKRAKFRSEITHGHNLGAADIDWARRNFAMRKAAQSLRGRITLPNEIDMAQAEVNRLTL